MSKQTLKKLPLHAARDETPEGFFANYAAYNQLLRTWFVTASVAIPSLFLLNDKLAEGLRSSGKASTVIAPLLGACAAQVALALLNKHISWFNYNSGLDPSLSPRPFYKAIAWTARQYVIDVIADVLTVVLFGISILTLCEIFLFPPTDIVTIGPAPD